MITHLKLSLPDTLYVKDPFSSELGGKIIETSIQLINAVGYEDFTFKKLASECKTTEASVYRYFISKQQLLSYLCSLYWTYISLLIELDFEKSQNNNKKNLHTILQVLTNSVNIKTLSSTFFMQELFKLVINQWQKVNHFNETESKCIVNANVAYNSFRNLFAKTLKVTQPKLKYNEAYADTIVYAIHNYALYSLKANKYKNSNTLNKQIQKFTEQLTNKIIA